MRVVSWILLLILVSSELRSAEQSHRDSANYLYPVKLSEGHYGLIDSSGIMRPESFKACIRSGSSSFACLNNDDEWVLVTYDKKPVLITENHKYVRRLEGLGANAFSLIHESDANLVGLYSREIYVDGMIAEWPEEFNLWNAIVFNSRILGQFEGKYGLFDLEQMIVIPPKYERLVPIAGDLLLAAVSDQDGRAFMDGSGHLLSEFTYGWAHSASEEDGVFFVKRSPDKIEKILMDTNLKRMGTNHYYGVNAFAEGRGPVKPTEAANWYYIDRRGDRVSDKDYSYASSYDNGVALVRVGDEWRLIDRDESITAELEGVVDIAVAAGWSEGAIVAATETRIGLIDRRGSWIWDRERNESESVYW